jgi:hypothetical protein
LYHGSDFIPSHQHLLTATWDISALDSLANLERPFFALALPEVIQGIAMSLVHSFLATTREQRPHGETCGMEQADPVLCAYIPFAKSKMCLGPEICTGSACFGCCSKAPQVEQLIASENCCSQCYIWEGQDQGAGSGGLVGD